MSQITSFGSGGGGGGTDIRTITGNDLIAVGPNLLHNINLVGLNGLLVQASATPNTLEISSGTIDVVQTVDDTETALLTIPIAASRAMTVTATIVGRRAGFGASLWGFVTYGARRAGAGAIAVPGAATLTSNDGAGTVGVSGRVVGNNIEITVRGEVATIWDWTGTYNTLTQT